MKIKSNFKDIFNNTQKEALINEIKGNLFEFLVAHNCAKSLKVEANFLKSLDFEMKSMLAQYEKWLKVNHKSLAKSLVILAKQTGDDLCQYLGQLNDVKNVILVGKIAKQSSEIKFYEADFLILTNNCEIPISLKLSKKNAYVSTKSAGIKSFIANYFNLYETANYKQEILSSVVDKLFFEMGSELYSRRALEFEGRFDSMWTGPELPGELDEIDHKSLSKMYQKLSENLYLLLKEFYQQDQQIFYRSLLPLLGFGQNEMIQVTCYYKDNQSYDFLCTKIFEQSKDQGQIEFLPFNQNTSSFEIMVNESLLQIRIKPMNKFTTASYKVNCSVRQH